MGISKMCQKCLLTDKRLIPGGVDVPKLVSEYSPYNKLLHQVFPANLVFTNILA